MRATYPAFYQLKEWLKTATPLGRFVNMNRLHIDQYEDSRDVEEGADEITVSAPNGRVDLEALKATKARRKGAER
jgi:hypothetical protein